jgi:hypothetical protein
MWHDESLDGELFEKLAKIDEKIAMAVAVAGCAHCGGSLSDRHGPIALAAVLERECSVSVERHFGRRTPLTVRTCGERGRDADCEHPRTDNHRRVPGLVETPLSVWVRRRVEKRSHHTGSGAQTNQ